MAEVLPTHSQRSIDMPKGNGPPAPLPNPPFMFPIQPENLNDMDSCATTPSSMDAAGPQRSEIRPRPERLSFNALPAFDFSPAATSPTTLPPSPSRSPSRRTPPVTHAGGHRRNGSEYVGGDITHGGPMLVSTSPTRSVHSSSHRRNGSGFVGEDTTSDRSVLVGMDPIKSEGISNPQPSIRLGPPIAQRGHAHRRSGAISSHDLSTILKPPTETKAGSAPTTPSEPIFQPAPTPELDRSSSQPVLSTSIQEPSLPVHQETSGPSSQPRPRARFSEKIDYIASRPLSTISSETSSSMSTIRANHSVSNSISSIVSAGSSSPSPNIYQTLRREQNLQNPEQDRSKSRPRTAEPRSQPSSRDWDWDVTDAQTDLKRPLSAPSSDAPYQDTESLGNIPTCGSSAPTKPTISDVLSQPALTDPTSVRNSKQDLQVRRPVSPNWRPKTSPEPKVTKRQGKGRSWAGLLSRRGRHHDIEGDVSMRLSPMPRPHQLSPEMEVSFDDINFDEDTTYIIESGSPYPPKVSNTQTDYATWKARESSPPSENDSSASVLDIDAALDSFDTQGYGPPFEDIVGEGSSSCMKRPMHSSGATGGFAGPGMHYHRRAESAPELDAIDRSRFGFPRLGSNPAMAIEEEEEDFEDDKGGSNGLANSCDAVLDTQQEERKEEQAPGLGVNIVETNTTGDQPMQRAPRTPTKNTGLGQEHRNELSPVEIVEADEEPRFSMITKSSDDSTITPTLSSDPLDTLPASAPVNFTMPTPALTYGTPDTPSAISSPDFTRTSFDAPRIHTATSSITDRTTLSSSRAGDQGLGLHGSIDDVPSLTSSASTMSAHPTRLSSSANSAADRSSSLSAAIPARTRPVSSHKRLSLASLSRLAGNSYNRSKLNIEESVPDEAVERHGKKRGNRISRMMKFWKSKEKLSTS